MIVFTGVRMIPGDPARIMAGTDADAAGIEEIREKYGLKDPIPFQYLRWVGLALRGDLGHSSRTREPVVKTVATKLPNTIELAFLSLLLAVGIAIPASVLAAVRRSRHLADLRRAGLRPADRRVGVHAGLSTRAGSRAHHGQLLRADQSPGGRVLLAPQSPHPHQGVAR